MYIKIESPIIYY